MDSEKDLKQNGAIEAKEKDVEYMLNRFIDECNKQQGSMPYNFNVLDEQCGHIVENSHTNMLMKLLQYNNQYGYVFLKNFFSFLGLEGINVDYGGKIEFHREKAYDGRIDGYIYQVNKFALIIENKINGAVSQKKQLERYITAVLADEKVFNNCTNKKDLIWVMYLTKDGIEQPDDDSIEYMKRKGICREDSNNNNIEGDRYIAVNYHEHILPWLKEEIQPIVMQKEQVLNTGLLQYIDFLEGMLGLRQSDAELLNSCRNWIKENITIDDDDLVKRNQSLGIIKKQLKDYVKSDKEEDIVNIRRYAGLLDNLLDEANDELMKDFFDITRKYFETEGLMGKCVISHIFNYYYIQIRDESWPRCIHFEWYPLGVNKLTNKRNKNYTLCLHIEGAKDVRDLFMTDNDLVDLIERKFNCNVMIGSRTISFCKEISPEKSIMDMKEFEKEKFLKEAYGFIDLELINGISNFVKKSKVIKNSQI